MSESFSTVQAISAVDFTDGLGVDTHIPYTDGEYSSISLVISDLQYLGITQVRDGITNGQNGSALLSSYISIAQAGIQFTFIMSGTDNADLEAELHLIDQVQSAVPGSVIAIEGPNEINNDPITFNGATGLLGALAMQEDIIADVAADPTLAGTAIDYFTGYGASGIGDGPDPVAAGLATYDNQHPYPLKNEAPGYWVNRAQALVNTTLSNEPAVYTETGYSTNAVDGYVQGVYTLDLLMDTAQQDISKTYLYDLLDAYAPGSEQGDDGYGLFSYTEAPKNAATYIHNLTSILQEASGGGTAISQTGSLSYALTGLPSDGNALLLEENNGDFMLAVWAEPQLWNDVTNSEIASPTGSVTISFENAFGSAEIFDPTVGSNALSHLSTGDSVTIEISDHPVLIDISSGNSLSIPCFAAGTRLLTTGGEVNVEDLKAGDRMITHRGEDAKIIWIGHRYIDLTRHGSPARVQPICISAGAFGDATPARDLLVSPDHALYLQGCLIPAKALVNGTSIHQLNRKSVIYYHVELARHDVIFAENLPVETYLDSGNRAAFENGGNVITLHPDFAQSHRNQRSCAPFVESGPAVAAARERVAARRAKRSRYR